jgi:DNA-binding response OmpR family regulator
MNDLNIDKFDAINSAGSQPAGQVLWEYEQANNSAIRLLFLGEKETANHLTKLVKPVGRHLGLTNRDALEVVALTNQKAALRAVRLAPPKVLLVQIDERPDSRARFCEMVRYRLPTAAIFAVGELSPPVSKIFDGYLQLPLAAEEVAAVLRTGDSPQTGYWLQRGPIRLNVATRTVFSPSGQHHMTPKQTALLQMLMRNADRVVSRAEIMKTIWETSYMDDTRTLDVHIRWLRERIEPDPSNPVYLLTVRGTGYRLQLP